ncbi:MAG TPA: hypothetical protein VF730_15140, partial [Terracidiphilus sp.]
RRCRPAERHSSPWADAVGTVPAIDFRAEPAHRASGAAFVGAHRSALEFLALCVQRAQPLYQARHHQPSDLRGSPHQFDRELEQ